MNILYISQNGITDHIGQSQIAPYLLGLSKLGFTFHLVSCEKSIGSKLHVQYQKIFEKSNIQWYPVEYYKRPPVLAPIFNQLRLALACRRVCRQFNIDFSHARSHPAGFIALSLKKRFRIKYLFDFRDFYANGGLDKERGLKRLVFRWIKFRESELVRNSDALVCLTDRAFGVLGKWYFSGDFPSSLVRQVIPCCADFSHFDGSRLSEEKLKVIKKDLRYEDGNKMIVYLGSLGMDYLLPEMLNFFKVYRGFYPKSRFLFLINNGAELVRDLAMEKALPVESVVIRSASREEVPYYLKISDLSLIFIRPDLAKAGCSPTKLAELFASNVPVVSNRGYGDIDSILDPEVNGSYLLDDFSRSSFEKVIRAVDLNQSKFDIRENSRNFSLEAGLIKYHHVYKKLLG